MIRGIGCDLVEIERIRKAAGSKKFLEKCFSDSEIAAFDQTQSIAFLAGNFAVKEAVVKAAGRGFRGFWPREIEVKRNDLGAPYVMLSPKAIEALGISENQIVYISISNTKAMAMAMAVLCKA